MPLDPTVAIVFGTLFLSLVLSLLYAFWQQIFKHKTSKRASELDLSRSIRVSELEGLIHKAVAEATLSLDERLATLEAEVQSLQDAVSEETEGLLHEQKKKMLLDLPAEETGEEIVRAWSRKQIR